MGATVDDESSDAEVVARVRAGDVDAYRLIVRRHYAVAFRYATRMLGNRWDAEEAVQDGFARAYRFLDRFDSNRRFDGWLFGILVNTCRTRGASQSRTDQPLVSIEPVHANHPTDTPLDENDVQHALMQLPRLHREALLLKYLDDRTYEEIAALTGTRVSAMKMRVKRAKAALEALLRGETASVEESEGA